MSHNPNGSTQNQCQSLSVPLAQQSVNRTYSSADLDTPRDIIDDISSTLTHTPEQDINDVDNSSETSESQSIDINSTTINNYVPNDCESLSIDVNDKCGSEKRRQKERKREKKTERKERRNSARERDRKRRNGSVLTDEEEDSIASRMKRRRNQQPDDDDDENTSYEY